MTFLTQPRSRLLASALALALSLGAAIPALAQSSPVRPSSAPIQSGPMHPPNFLDLTAEQQAQMDYIRQNERSQIDAILTAEQRAQLQQPFQNQRLHLAANHQDRDSAEGDREPPPSPFESLDLTTEQRAQIEAITDGARGQFEAILTPEQHQQLQQHRPPLPQQN